MLIALAITILVVGANIVRSNAVVRELQVRVRYNGCDTLVSAATIERAINTTMPTMMSLKVKEIDTRNIKQCVMRSPYIENCQAYVSILGNVVVKADQRHPLLHVYQNGRQYYIDRQGRYMPLSNEGMAHVTIASGHLHTNDTLINISTDFSLWQNDTLLQLNDMSHLWILAHYIDDNGYGSLFDQIYRDQNGDFILTPKAGTHVVNVGNTDDLDDKFERLMALYDQALPRVGWDRYKVVNLKYNDQVVCKKR